MKQIPKGYKHTALGILPQDWEVVRLGEVMDFLKTYQNPRSDLNDYDDIHYVHYGEIHTKYQHFIDFNRAVLPKINQKNLKMPLSLLQNGDVIVVDASEDIIDIAKSVEIQNLDSVIAESLRGSATNEAIHKRKIQAVAGLHTFLLRDRGQYFANNYKGYILYNQDVRRNIQRLATGISVFAISKTNLSNILIPLPPIKEQEKIAQILNTWDSYIDNLEKLIEAKQRHKKGLMQRLLTPPQEDLTGGLPRSLTTFRNDGLALPLGGKHNEAIQNLDSKTLDCHDLQSKSRNDIQALRFKEFSGTWQEVKLGEVFSEYTFFNLKSYPQYTIGKNGIKPFFDTRHTIEKHKTFALFDLIIGIGIDEVNVNIGVNFGSCSPIYNTYKIITELLNPYFAYYYIKIGLRRIQNKITKKSTRREFEFDKKEFLKHSIFIPTLQEQEKIARVLSLCDEEMQTLKKMLEYRKKQKRGLMQNLLSGKVRVKV